MRQTYPFITIVFVVAVCIGIVADNPRYVFASAALVIFGFLTVGFFLFPRLSAAIPFRVGPVPESEGKENQVLLAGTQISPSEFPQHFACVLRLRSWPVLVALALLSLSLFCFLVSSFPLRYFVEGHFFEGIYLPVFFMAAAFAISTKWYSEQNLLARSVITLGVVTGVESSSGRRQIKYEFRDSEGGYFGGVHRDFSGRQVDHLIFVVYDRTNPDHSCSSRGFMFRDFRIYPLRNQIENS